MVKMAKPTEIKYSASANLLILGCLKKPIKAYNIKKKNINWLNRSFKI
tara:strand:+ start:26 stop:169 length:144 start_codon:yes stop_codon:yes gene_type:complete